MRRFVPHALGVMLVAALAACGGGGGGNGLTVTGVVVTPSTATVEEGKTVPLAATVQPAGVPQAVTWTTSDPAIATVSNGVVTGVSQGTATITATSVADSTRSGSATVTVTESDSGGPQPDPDEDPITVDCSAAGELSDDITTPTTLPVDCYRVTRNVTVSSALTVVPGTVLQFTTNAGLRVADGGSLAAVGTVVNPIRFTSASGSPDDWRGVGIFTDSSNNVLAHVIIEKAGRARQEINGGNRTNAYVGPNGRVAIRDSVFREAGNQGVGLHVAASTSVLSEFERNTFDGNDGAAMRITGQQLGMIGPGNVFGLNAIPSAAHIRVASSADLRASATWPAADVPYRLSGNHIVDDSGTVITIEAGATLQFESTAGFRVLAGALRLLGQAGSPVTFTSASGNPDDWRGVGISSASAQNEIRHAVFENAGRSRQELNRGTRTNLMIDENARVKITDSMFADSGGHGVYVFGDSASLDEFARNTFSGNATAPLRLYSTQLDMIEAGNSFSDAPEAFRHVRVEGATITTDQFVRRLEGGAVYRFFGNHFVDDSTVTVEIEPGATLEFDGSSGMRVRSGALQALGTPGERITFTSASGNPGGWRGLAIASSGDNALQHVKIEKAGNSRQEINNGTSTNLYVHTGATVAVTDSAFNDSSGFGIFIAATGEVTDQDGDPIDPLTDGNNTFSGNGNLDVGP